MRLDLTCSFGHGTWDLTWDLCFEIWDLTWDLGFETWDLTWDLGIGTWDSTWDSTLGTCKKLWNILENIPFQLTVVMELQYEVERIFTMLTGTDLLMTSMLTGTDLDLNKFRKQSKMWNFVKRLLHINRTHIYAWIIVNKMITYRTPAINSVRTSTVLLKFELIIKWIKVISEVCK